MKANICVTMLLCCATIVSASYAEEVGSVDTEFKWLGPDHKIVVEAFDDPKIESITCYLSRSKKGGLRSNKRGRDELPHFKVSVKSGPPQTDPIFPHEK